MYATTPTNTATSPLYPAQTAPQQAIIASTRNARGASPEPVDQMQHQAVVLKNISEKVSFLHKDLNETMTFSQSSAARVLTVAGTLTALGGAGAAAFFSVTALAGTASGLGVPVAVLAALTGLAVFVAGASVAMLMAGIVRSMLRKNLKNEPDLQNRLMSASLVRTALLAKPTLTHEEKFLLKQLNYVLAKTEGFGSAMKAQTKTAAKAVGWTALSVVVVPLLVLTNGAGLDMGTGSHSFNIGNAKSSRFFGKKIDPNAVIDLNIAEGVYAGL